jgi:hypothetical protein
VLPHRSLLPASNQLVNSFCKLFKGVLLHTMLWLHVLRSKRLRRAGRLIEAKLCEGRWCLRAGTSRCIVNVWIAPSLFCRFSVKIGCEPTGKARSCCRSNRRQVNAIVDTISSVMDLIYARALKPRRRGVGRLYLDTCNPKNLKSHDLESLFRAQRACTDVRTCTSRVRFNCVSTECTSPVFSHAGRVRQSRMKEMSVLHAARGNLKITSIL